MLRGQALRRAGGALGAAVCGAVFTPSLLEGSPDALFGGEKTKMERSKPALTTFYGSWFCPYVQRVWIALEEKGVDYEYVEIDPYRKAEGSATKIALTLEEKQERYPEFVAASPRGLVPALVRGGAAVADSMVMLEYVEEAWQTGGAELLPFTPEERAHSRYWINFANERIIPYYYRMLMARDDKGRTDARQAALAGMEEFSAAMSEDGPFFAGQSFSLVDIALFPWYERFLTVGAAYRGFQTPKTPAFERLNKWHAAVRARPSVSRTLADPKRLIENYAGYADNSATSDAANKFRQ
uniref:Glutathione transferase n=1 Tax=Chrysotila carterae TaxID=13221 RepID=A0A7S4C6T0_CHRCT|mmetsp:Transcript_33057/g.72650  ORF Transcript_33057/g.72650 Transcript_33057/m.72650 type:complete len:297 (+) Transcript_33057:211-1101(+)|eukprot:6208590-Pleurochrysis_carterae.AAC.1